MSICRNLVFATAAAALVGTPFIADARTTSGRISISETQFGFLVGGNVGGGTLTYNGKIYKFKIGGISVGKIGVAKIRGYGRVSNLTNISNFAGTYVAADASATAVKGAGSIKLKKGDITLELDTSSKGLQLSASGGGVKITLE
ncbi:DUF1134 domain-containing protein [Sphingomonas sp. AP4-R1]|uniref:DUF1134 domain-containing protein n=1 Tax=Sphingomonas sp. AP4-R1 TaxID=2735134 RepID=UPI0014933850|nr:DUF1134 domain-containing protein [Sphingomonas sp. AP4-R1]QJU57330.1 DUF1134 domain-containing protein [Sphingomonas sp. AP4-R1]